MSQEIILKLEDICHSYSEGELVLSNINFEVEKEEILCLLGQSGCGKTTALRVIAGFEKVENGKIIIDGKAVSTPQKTIPPEDRGVGVVFQDYVLFPHLNVKDNILFGIKKWPKAEAQSRADNLMAKLDLHRVADHFPQELSGGQKQRVALARALAPKPKLLLMDEPFSNLDRNLREKMKVEVVRVLREEKLSVVWITHDQWEAFDVADRVGVMRNGKVEQIGTPLKLYNEPCSSYIAEFVGDGFWLKGSLFQENSIWMVKTELGVTPTYFCKGVVDQISTNDLVKVYFRPEVVECVKTGGIPVKVTQVFYRGHDFHVTAELNQQSIKFLCSYTKNPKVGDQLQVKIIPTPLACFK